MTDPHSLAPRRGKPVTTRDIARQCGVHHITVSRALCNDPRVKPDTAARILATARALGYEFESGYVGQRLAALRHSNKVIHKVIGVFYPLHLVRIAYFAEIFEGIMTTLAYAGYTLHLIPTIDTDPQAHELTSLPTSLKRGDLDGVILTRWTYQDSDRVLRELREESTFGDKPITVLMGELPGCSSVSTDDYQGMTALMRHLLDAGHRRFVHCYWHQQATRTDMLRYTAMRDTCLAYGLDPQACLQYEGLDFDHTPYYRIDTAVLNTLNLHRDATAFIAPNDFYAVQAYELFRRKGLRIPDDLSLVGFDDTIPIPGQTGNLLTTIHLPLEEVGVTAARHLIATIEGTDNTPQQIVLPCGPVIVRGTTGPAPER